MNNLQRAIEILKSKGLVELVRRVPSRLVRKKHVSDEVLYRNLGNYREYRKGTDQWLQAAEKHFGGISRNVERRTVSPDDPRDAEKIKAGGMIGGDRMLHHGYASFYAKHLIRFLEKKELVIVECGILKGTGLAIWSELFPQAKIFGLDIDPSHFYDNIDFLKSRGSFKNHDPQILVFDQFNIDTSELIKRLGDKKIDIVIDDGFHSNTTIMNTLDGLWPLLEDKSVYFVEDNAKVVSEIRETYKNAEVFSYGDLTVLEKK